MSELDQNLTTSMYTNNMADRLNNVSKMDKY